MPVQILQGTLDLMVLRTLATMGPQHAYAIATRLEQSSGDLLKLNQGTLYPALVRLEQHGWTRGTWGKTENNREAKYYAITKAGLKALEEETQRWRQTVGLIDKMLAEEQ
jgi:PadR family transcriptional regulator, regulatory protein PadR